MNRKLTLAVAAFAAALSLSAAFAADDAADPRGFGFHHGPRAGFGHGPAMAPRHFQGGEFARGPRGIHPMFGHGRLMDELEVTDAQKTELVDVMTNNFRQGMLARMEMAEAHKKLAELSSTKGADDAAIIAANEAIGAARGKLEVLGRKAQDDFRAVLTPEQAAKLDEMRDRRPDAPNAPDAPDAREEWRGRPRHRGSDMPRHHGGSFEYGSHRGMGRRY